MSREFTANYVFAKNNVVVLRHPKGKFLRVSPNELSQLDEDGGREQQYARWNIQLHGQQDGVKVVKLQSQCSGGYLRIHNYGKTIDVEGKGGEKTRFKVHKTGKNTAKLESCKFPGKYPAVQPKGCTIGSGGKWTEFAFFTMPKPKMQKEELQNTLKTVADIKNSLETSDESEKVNSEGTNFMMESVNDLNGAINDILFKSQVDKEFDVEKATKAARESIFRDQLKVKDFEIQRLRKMIAAQENSSKRDSINELVQNTMDGISKIDQVSNKLRKSSMQAQETDQSELINDLQEEVARLKEHLQKVLTQLAYYEVDNLQ